MKQTNRHGANYHLFYRFGRVPYEIMVNGVICEIDLKDGMPGPSELNQYLLKSGAQQIKIKVLHPFLEKGGKFQSDQIKSLNKDLAIYDIENDSKQDMDLKLVKKLHFPDIKKPVPYLQHQWSFNAKLPYTLEGWTNGEDLSEWDEDRLEEQVVAKFEQLRRLLNRGDGVGFVDELEQANREYFKANYFTEEEKKEYIANLTRTYSKHKGLMPPIGNYRMRIMGGGKVVALETLGKYKGQGILTAENEKEGVLYMNYVMLYKPKDGSEFKVVRINSNLTSLGACRT